MRTRIVSFLLGGLLLASCGQQSTPSGKDNLPDPGSLTGVSTTLNATADTDFVFELSLVYGIYVSQGTASTIPLTIRTIRGYPGTSTLSVSLAASSETHPLPEGLSVSPTTIQMVEGEARTYPIVISATRNAPPVTDRFVNLVLTAEDGRSESAYMVVSVWKYSFRQVDTMLEHTCSIAVDNKAYCWGEGGNGQLGHGSYSNSNVPVAVNMPAGVGFKQISAGEYHTCALGTNSKAYCWGYGTGGRLGNGSENWSAVPVEVSAPPGVQFASVSAGAFITCAVSSEQKAYCWGDGRLGQLGNGTNEVARTPVAVRFPTETSVWYLDVGYSHVCADGVDTTGKTGFCWGEGDRWQLGTGSSDNTNTPVKVRFPSGVSASGFSAGTYYTCGIGLTPVPFELRVHGAYYCWGNGFNGQLGHGTNDGSILPTRLGFTAGEEVAAGNIATGSRHTCATATGGRPFCWGEDTYGQLGRGFNGISSNVPVRIIDHSGYFSGIVVGDSHTCALAYPDKAYCWGRNHKGQLGNGSYSNSNVPVEVVLPQ